MNYRKQHTLIIYGMLGTDGKHWKGVKYNGKRIVTLM